MRTHVPFSEAPVTIASNLSPIARGSSSSAAADLRTCRSTLSASSSCSRAVRGQRVQSSPSSYGGGVAGDRRLQQPLRDQVRDSGGSAPSSARSRAPRARSARRSARRARRRAYSPRPSSLTTDERQVGEARRDRRARRSREERLERARHRAAAAGGRRTPARAATMRSQRSATAARAASTASRCCFEEARGRRRSPRS